MKNIFKKQGQYVQEADVDVRANIVILKHGSIENAISFLNSELEEYEKIWSKCSWDNL